MVKMTEKAARGQTIRTEGMPDREKDVPGCPDAESLMGRKMKGGPRDTSHSLSSAGDVVDYMNDGMKGGNR